jgi:hypothetical protein
MMPGCVFGLVRVFQELPFQVCASGLPLLVVPMAMQPLLDQQDTLLREPRVELLWIHDWPFHASVSVFWILGPKPGWVLPTATHAVLDMQDTALRPAAPPRFGGLWTVQASFAASAAPASEASAQSAVATIRVRRLFITRLSLV